MAGCTSQVRTDALPAHRGPVCDVALSRAPLLQSTWHPWTGWETSPCRTPACTTAHPCSCGTAPRSTAALCASAPTLSPSLSPSRSLKVSPSLGCISALGARVDIPAEQHSMDVGVICSVACACRRGRLCGARGGRDRVQRCDVGGAAAGDCDSGRRGSRGACPLPCGAPGPMRPRSPAPPDLPSASPGPARAVQSGMVPFSNTTNLHPTTVQNTPL